MYSVAEINVLDTYELVLVRTYVYVLGYFWVAGSDIHQKRTQGSINNLEF